METAMTTKPTTAGDLRPGDTVLVPAHLVTRSTYGSTVTLTFSDAPQIVTDADQVMLVEASANPAPAPSEPVNLGAVIPYRYATGEAALLVKVGPGLWYSLSAGVSSWEEWTQAGVPLVEHAAAFEELNEALAEGETVLDQDSTRWFYAGDGELYRESEDVMGGEPYNGDAPFPVPPFRVV